MKPVIALVVFGATVGTLLDALHTFSRTTEYTHPFVLATAWWVPLLFASAYGFGGTLYAHGHRRLGGRGLEDEPLPSWRALVIALVVYASLYAITAYLPASNIVKLSVVLVGAAGLFFSLDPTRQGLMLALVAAVLGPLTEIVLVRVGVFRHLQPDFLGIPMWLPALYLACGPSFGQLARKVTHQAT